MRRRILRYGLSLILCAVAATGLATGFLFRGYYIGALTRNMSGIVRLVDSRIADLPEGEDPQSRYDRLVREAVEDVGSQDGAAVRVTLIADDGRVLADSDEDASVMENHAGRPEVADALARPGEIATSSRYSVTVGYSMLYTAVYDEAAGVVVRAAIALTALHPVYARIALFCLLGFAAGLAAAVPLSVAMSGGITRPIARLTAAAHGIAEGRYEPIADLNTGTQFDALAADFNAMSARLRETVNELTDRNAQLNAVLTCMNGGLLAVDASGRVILINPQARTWLDLPGDMPVEGRPLRETVVHAGIAGMLSDNPEEGSRTEEFTLPSPVPRVVRVSASAIVDPRDGIPRGRIATLMDVTRMRTLEKMRSDFVANVTHELRTPLTSIKGYVETLRGGAAGDPGVRERFLQIIDIEAERLHSLITDILELSDIEAGSPEAGSMTFPLEAVVRDVSDLMTGKAREKAVTLHADIPVGLTMTANPDRIKQMLLNLVDNAVKYNVEGGAVFLSARSERGRTVLSVRDTGIGIAEEHLSRLFERFYRVDKSRSRQMGGTGLGLSIVKHIAGIYGGNVRIDSAAGRGTEIIVEIPERPAVRGEAQRR